MPFESFAAFYQSDAQSVFLLHVLPLAFLGWRAAVAPAHERAVLPAASSFAAGWTLLFAVLTLIDPWATGPLVRALGVSDGFGGSALMFGFVWLGDFRVLALIFVVASKRGAASGETEGAPIGAALGRAALLTFLVPVSSGVLNAGLHALAPGLPDQTLWLIYELGFLGLAIWIGRRWVARHVDDAGTAAYLRALAGYSAAYYALWASADLVILGLGADAGWAMRVVPNQLYYGGWVVFAYARFYCRESRDGRDDRAVPPPASPKAEARSVSSTSTHASR